MLFLIMTLKEFFQRINLVADKIHFSHPGQMVSMTS